MAKKWQKVLYIDQGYPDNYVDESFLVDLKKNLYTRTYYFWPAVIESGVVTQQVCSVCLFVVSFMYMDSGELHPYLLFSLSAVTILIGYILNDLLDGGIGRTKSNRTRWDDLKSCLIFVAFGYGLSPLLMTLTETISTDTIYSMTFFMLLANLIFHDYLNSAEAVLQALSLNAAIFASICLASRLSTTWHAFATLTFAVQVFALWPLLRVKIKKETRCGQVLMTVVSGLTTLIAVLSVSRIGAVMFILGHAFVTFLCPALLIKLQPYKNNIYGPWDEAVIKD